MRVRAPFQGAAMGLLGTAAMRFVRTKWKTTQALAEELFATFGGPLDLRPQSITIVQPAGAALPPIEIIQPEGSTVPPIQITKGGVSTPLGGGTGGGGGGIDLGEVEFPEQNPGDAAEATPPPALNPIMLHGLVLGKVGGQVYSVRCWAKNPAVYPPIGVLPVEFTMVDAADTIPAGHRTPVIAFPKLVFNVVQIEKAVGYVPVWYAE